TGKTFCVNSSGEIPSDKDHVIKRFEPKHIASWINPPFVDHQTVEPLNSFIVYTGPLRSTLTDIQAIHRINGMNNEIIPTSRPALVVEYSDWQILNFLHLSG